MVDFIKLQASAWQREGLEIDSPLSFDLINPLPSLVMDLPKPLFDRWGFERERLKLARQRLVEHRMFAVRVVVTNVVRSAPKMEPL